MAKKQIEQTEIEAPYELPEGWKWVRISDVSECKDGYRKPVNADERNNRQGNIPYYGATGQVGWIDDYLTDEQLVLVGEDGAPFLDLIKDKAYLIEGKAWVNNHAHILKSKYAENGNKFLLYYLNNFNYTGYVNGTTRLKLTQSTLLGIPFPLPPTLEEQQRIVNRIETLFVKLDQAKEKAQNVVESFETRKASILHKAFTGELTKKWREENGVEDDSWEEKKLEEISLKITDGEHSTPKRVDSFCGYYLLSARNIHNGEIRLNDVDYVEESEYERIRKRCNPDKNDILISCSGSVGRVCVIQDDNKYVMVRSAAMIKIKECNSFFIAYMLQTFNVQQQIEKTKKQSCQANLFLGAIKELVVPVPSLPEQTEIVRILDVILEKETKAKAAAEAVLEQIDLLKKSILARAFRGEL